MRYLMAAFVMTSLAACQTPIGTNSIQAEFDTFPTGCVFKPTLPPDAHVVLSEDKAEIQRRLDNKGHGAAFHASTPGATFSNLCMCGDTWGITKDTATEQDAKELVHTYLNRGEWELTSFTFNVKNVPLDGADAMSKFSGKRSSFVGPLTIEGQVIFAGQCMMVYSASTLLNQQNLITDYIASIKKTSPQTTTADAATRLRRLDDLRKDKLITEDEYLSRRASILNDL